MSVEQQKQEAEQNTLVENSSNVNVKTPLVDALRSYFARTIQYGQDGCPLSYPDPI